MLRVLSIDPVRIALIGIGSAAVFGCAPAGGVTPPGAETLGPVPSRTVPSTPASGGQVAQRAPAQSPNGEVPSGAAQSTDRPAPRAGTTAAGSAFRVGDPIDIVPEQVTLTDGHRTYTITKDASPELKVKRIQGSQLYVAGYVGSGFREGWLAAELAVRRTPAPEKAAGSTPGSGTPPPAAEGDRDRDTVRAEPENDEERERVQQILQQAAVRAREQSVAIGELQAEVEAVHRQLKTLELIAPGLFDDDLLPPSRPPAFRGFLGEVRRQAEEAGEFAANQQVARDHSRLQKQLKDATAEYEVVLQSETWRLLDPEGRRLVRKYRLIPASAYSLVATLTGHTDTVGSLAFSPDGKTLASASGDHSVKLWDVAAGTERAQLTGHSDKVFAVAISPDGTLAATGSGDGLVILWDLATGRRRTTLNGQARSTFCVAFAPDGKTLASGCNDGAAILWDIARGERMKTLTGHADAIMAVRFSPDGKSLATGSWDKTARLWDLAEGSSRTLRGHSDLISSVAFSPDGRLLATGGFDKTIHLWDARTGDHRFPRMQHEDYISALAFTSDGKALASSSGDRSVKFWNVADGVELAEFRCHTQAVSALALAPDGKLFATGSFDRTGKLWRLPAEDPSAAGR